MAIDQPNADNFVEKTLEPEVETTVVEREDIVNLVDLQALQLELNSAYRENRSPRLKPFNDATVRAAGIDPETRKIQEYDETEGVPTLAALAPQTPAENEDGVVNETNVPGAAAEPEFTEEERERALTELSKAGQTTLAPGADTPRIKPDEERINPTGLTIEGPQEPFTGFDYPEDEDSDDKTEESETEESETEQSETEQSDDTKKD